MYTMFQRIRGVSRCFGWRCFGCLIAVVGLWILQGCAAYRPQALSTAPSVADDLEEVQARVRLRTPGQVAHRFDPSDGLDLTEVAILAVVNSPQLRAQRARLQVARAQAFAAGLLPDPQLDASLDHPTGGIGLTNAFMLGLSYDLIPLITRGAGLDAARPGQRQVRLDVLWQEWQTIQQARTLALRSLFVEQRLSLLNQMRGMYQSRYVHSAQALAQGDITLETRGRDLAALLDVLSQIRRLEESANQTRHALSLLLGLSPEMPVSLIPPPAPGPVDTARTRALLASLPDRRPDLLALKCGYAAQEARVRAEILSQFPSLSVGITRAHDTSGDNTVGFGVGLTLPLFSRNRGRIAVARATREQLRAEYRARLAQTASQVRQLLDLQRILIGQQRRLEVYLPRLGELVAEADSAYKSQDIDVLTFLSMEATWTGKRLEEIKLQETLWENRIALNALLAIPEGTGGTLTLSRAVIHE